MIKTHPVYLPLYEAPSKPIILITGGRASGKSFAVSTFLERLSFEFQTATNKYGEEERIVHNILFSRYTMTSAELSVIPEFLDKVEADNVAEYFRATKQDVVNLKTGGKIMFRGIKTSSGNQTAKLKSIHGITTFVCDEAEEWTSEQEFMTIMLSIRQKGIQNRIIIVMNPTDKHHFIYKRYIENSHRIEYFDGVPVQISTDPSVLHIHTTYLDNLQNLSEEFLNEVRRIKENDPKRYAHTIMGRWADEVEGAIFENWEIVDEFPEYSKHQAVGLDFGFTCFRGDTLVTTRRGDVPIKDITTDDEVLTRYGYRKVLKVHNNGIKKVVSKCISAGDHTTIIHSTLNHNFNANGKWKKYGELTKGDNLFVLSRSAGSNTGVTPMENTPITTITNGMTKRVIIPNYCITPSGSLYGEQSLKVWLFTILTRIRSITNWKTLWLSLRRNTHGCIVANWRNFVGKTDTQKKIGRHGERSQLKGCNQVHECANIAGPCSSQQTHISDFVQRDVTTDGNIQHQNFLCHSLANGAERSLRETNTLSPNAAQMIAHINSRAINSINDVGVEYAEVYDLTIDGYHEYFANGILVHNCDPTAAVRCGILDDSLYIDELFYRTGMLSSDIARELHDTIFPGMSIIADSADPRLIQEIANTGLLIYAVLKGPNSIQAGIDKMKTFKIRVTRRSVNVINELRNYTWAKDKDGNFVNVPIDAYNHALDATRYYVLGKLLGRIMRTAYISADDLP